MPDSYSELVDCIYEASMIPELWSKTCELVAAEIGAYSASVITISPDGHPRWVTSECNFDNMITYEREGWGARNDRPARALALGMSSFAREIDFLTPEELAREPISAELLRPHGIAWEMGAVVQEPSGAILVNSILNKTEDGPFTDAAVARMEEVRADLQRAAFLATRLGFREATTMTDVLETIGLPAAVIDDGGSVISMNAGLEALAPRLRTGFRDRLLVGDAEANRLLQDVLTQHRLGIAPVVQSIPVVAEEERPALILNVVPIKRNARDIFSRGRSVVAVTTVGEVGPPDLRVICGLFDLTRAEALVAREIAGGLSVEEAAVKLGIGRETLRTHMKAIFRKTGVQRQSQLVLLLSEAALKRGF